MRDGHRWEALKNIVFTNVENEGADEFPNQTNIGFTNVQK